MISVIVTDALFIKATRAPDRLLSIFVPSTIFNTRTLGLIPGYQVEHLRHVTRFGHRALGTSLALKQWQFVARFKGDLIRSRDGTDHYGDGVVSMLLCKWNLYTDLSFDKFCNSFYQEFCILELLLNIRLEPCTLTSTGRRVIQGRAPGRYHHFFQNLHSHSTFNSRDTLFDCQNRKYVSRPPMFRYFILKAHLDTCGDQFCNF